MPIYKMTDKNGKNIRKDGLQKYRVRVNYTDSFGKPHQIDRVTFGAETAKQLEIQLTQKLNTKEIAPKMTIGQLLFPLLHHWYVQIIYPHAFKGGQDVLFQYS